MAKSVKKESVGKNKSAVSRGFKLGDITKQQKFVIGVLLVLFAIALLVAFISFYIYGQEDQNAVNELTSRTESVQNWLGKLGAYLSNIIVYQGFGLASFLFVRLFFLTGIYLIVGLSIRKLKAIWFWDLFALIIFSNPFSVCFNLKT